MQTRVIVPWVPETFLARFPVSVKSYPREKQSAIALMALIQSLARLNQLVHILDTTADWLLLRPKLCRPKLPADR